MRSPILASLALGALFIGCVPQGAKSPPSANSRSTDNEVGDTYQANAGNGATGELSALRDRMCACADTACARLVRADFDKWMKANSDGPRTEGQEQNAAQIADRFAECYASAMAAETRPGRGMRCSAAGLCATGLECIKYYGIAGPRGGEHSSCEERCGKGKADCGAGLQCVMVSDGPGQVCRAAIQRGNKPGTAQKCGADGTCAEGLECIKYYGIAGPRGGERSSCEQRCGKGKAPCAKGQRCSVITDGPGQVCR